MGTLQVATIGFSIQNSLSADRIPRSTNRLASCTTTTQWRYAANISCNSTTSTRRPAASSV